MARSSASTSRAEARTDLAEKQFAAASPGADGLRQQFIQADEDGDGRINRDEWLRWFGPALADKAADGQQSTPN